MKKITFRLSFWAVVLALFPVLFIGSPIIVSYYFGMIMTAPVLLFVVLLLSKQFGFKQECLTIYSNKFGINIQRDFFALPIVYWIIAIEMLALFIFNPICVALNFALFVFVSENITLMFLLNIIFRGEYKITKEKLREEY